MRRLSGLWPAILTWDNFHLAAYKAAKGRRHQATTRLFTDRLDENLGALIGDLLAGRYEPGPFNRFIIHDPKRRIIHAPSFRDRVLHHAVMNRCEPVFEARLISTAYACRKGKGQHAALKKAACMAGRYRFFLKMDVSRYFDSIDHLILFQALVRVFKDRPLLVLFDQILDSYANEPGKGLPIGALTSQHFANFYLAPLDRFVKQALGVKGFLRYMDDFVIWGDDKRVLRDQRDEIVVHMADYLALKPKPSPFINRTGLGMDFLGFRIFPGAIRMSKRGKKRHVKKLRVYRRAFEDGALTERALQKRCDALVGATRACGGYTAPREELSWMW